MATHVEEDVDKDQMLSSLKEFQENFKVRQNVFLSRSLSQ